MGIPSTRFVYQITLIIACGATGLLVWAQKTELLPQLWLSIIAALLSYWACLSTAEKLRLDLFEKRFEIYKNTLEYCSVVAAYASLERRDENADAVENAVRAAHESFRGIGYHRTKALFGEDIVSLFDQLNGSFAYIRTFGHQRVGAQNFDAHEYWRHVNTTVEVTSKLPDHFKQYVYFGDHKKS